ncbi:hypothetical protein MGLY_10170 [Neomoorella glycerini]|uniref:Uncharacterized protein n=1 Tax=Neomoorella glycerini TaxID=55779 RepID=A0A6I5ZPY3_9FIRM|nr:hypothetical protein [Moorella glycerini]QGP91675.1 hypothetical protein MGLY_10170 [Moorella glycerini]
MKNSQRQGRLLTPEELAREFKSFLGGYANLAATAPEKPFRWNRSIESWFKKMAANYYGG